MRTDSTRSSARRKLRSEMISAPQGDFKHTGHVGPDGAYFGDLSFLGGSKGNVSITHTFFLEIIQRFGFSQLNYWKFKMPF